MDIDPKALTKAEEIVAAYKAGISGDETVEPEQALTRMIALALQEPPPLKLEALAELEAHLQRLELALSHAVYDLNTASHTKEGCSACALIMSLLPEPAHVV